MARRIVLLNGIPAGSTIALIRSPSSAPLHDGMSLMLLGKYLTPGRSKYQFGVPIWRWSPYVTRFLPTQLKTLSCFVGPRGQ
ncbi:hypothetical protein V1478_001156, partial [Vespula squamosa]